VLAAGQRDRLLGGQLKAAGLEGRRGDAARSALMEQLPERALVRTRPHADEARNQAAFAATIKLNIPLATLLDLANAQGER